MEKTKFGNIIIVGHGPSLLDIPRGAVIDAHDTVIRMKFPPKEKEFYGGKTDIMGGSLTIAQRLTELPGDMKWVFLDSRHANLSATAIDHALPGLFANKKLQYNKSLCDQWDHMYRQYRTPIAFDSVMTDSPSSDSLGERHLSQGFKALLYTAYYIKPRTVNVVGFDNIKNGYFTWSVTRGEDWTKYPKHRWDVEHKMLDMLYNRFQMEVNFL